MDNPETPVVPITKKMGRPLGSKNKPKWWPKPPKRPPGRPKGSKNKPKITDLGEALSQALSEALAEPPRPPVKARKRKARKSQIKHPTYKKMNAKERTQVGKKLAEASRGKSGRKPGVPVGWRHQDYALMVEQADAEARKIFNYMAQEGLIPEEEMAQAALLEALRIMKNKAANHKDKLSAGRLLLDFTRSKPAAKSDVTIRGAEAFLEALAADEENDGPKAT